MINLKNINTTTVFKDIRFWIILFFIIRLYGITLPPLEVSHNWRQTTVTMVARNFLEIDANIFYPRIDIAGEKTGITGMEFPVFNYLIYLASEIFGYQHWYGRLINLLISSLGLYFFYGLINKYFSKSTAFYATIILSVSVWFAFSRKIMPDTFSSSLLIMSLYFGSNYLEEKNPKHLLKPLILYFFLLMFGALSKMPSAYILIVFILFYIDKNISIKRKSIFFLVSTTALLPTFWWYFSWVPYLVETYGFWHFFMGKSFLVGAQEIMNNFPQTLSRFYETALKYTGFVVFLLGFYFAIKNKKKLLLYILLLSFLSFTIIIIKAGFTFPHHSYYIIPFVPIMALMAGYGLAQLKNQKWALTLLLIIAAEGILNQQHDFRIKEKEWALVDLDTQLDNYITKDDLILINSAKYPTPMYFSHRKGWVNTNEMILQKAYIKELNSKGLQYILILKRSFGSPLKLDYKLITENDDFALYQSR
ncbi:MAG: hypothetical protein B7C24_07495 [Bacteroidetes bacterium 4572_77]|nr:MAG: hypothetical protein B7C24_07495 [Bacteroidetes bacterium 4572_77]